LTDHDNAASSAVQSSIQASVASWVCKSCSCSWQIRIVLAWLAALSGDAAMPCGIVFWSAAASTAAIAAAKWPVVVLLLVLLLGYPEAILHQQH
jgi:hypothetical protein